MGEKNSEKFWAWPPSLEIEEFSGIEFNGAKKLIVPLCKANKCGYPLSEKPFGTAYLITENNF